MVTRIMPFPFIRASLAVLLTLVSGFGLAPRTGAQSQDTAANPKVTTHAPTGWWKNGSKPAAYVVGVDREIDRTVDRGFRGNDADV
jgi:hypothetical protein